MKKIFFFLTTMAFCLPAAEKIPGLLFVKPGQFKPITEPPCSYCQTQHLKGFTQKNDRVVAWLRSRHDGGAVPLLHFLSGQRVVNDSYGLFFYDPDGGYGSAFKKDYTATASTAGERA